MEVTQNRSGPDALKLRFTKFGAGRVALCGGSSSVHHAGGLRQSALPRASHDRIFRESVRGIDTIHPVQSQADGDRLAGQGDTCRLSRFPHRLLNRLRHSTSN